MVQINHDQMQPKPLTIDPVHHMTVNPQVRQDRLSLTQIISAALTHD